MLANFILLAHAVVPHHHHDKLICFKSAHCNQDDLRDEHGTTRDGHSHDGDSNHNDCALKEPVGVLSNQSRSDLLATSSTDRSGLDNFDYNILNTNPEIQISVLSTFVFERATHGSYSALVSASLGLRAPPAV